MSKLRVNAFTVSADGFGAGPDQGVTSRSAAAANTCTSGSFQPAPSGILRRDGGTTGVDNDFAVRSIERAREAPPATVLYATAALLLAYMTVSKLYPGMLIVYLLFRRDWRAAAWTVTVGIVLAVVRLIDLVLPAHLAFLDHLPRLLSGESFPNLRNPNGISANMSVPGLVRKLSLYGLPWSSFDAMRVVAWIYTLVIVAVVARLARAGRSTAFEPVVWLVILLLATLRSPILPVYGIFPTVWLLSILLAARWDRPQSEGCCSPWFVAFALVTPAWTLWPPAFQRGRHRDRLDRRLDCRGRRGVALGRVDGHSRPIVAGRDWDSNGFHAASRMSELRKSSNAASHVFNHLRPYRRAAVAIR